MELFYWRRNRMPRLILHIRRRSVSASHGVRGNACTWAAKNGRIRSSVPRVNGQQRRTNWNIGFVLGWREVNIVSNQYRALCVESASAKQDFKPVQICRGMVIKGIKRDVTLSRTQNRLLKQWTTCYLNLTRIVFKMRPRGVCPITYLNSILAF